MDSFSGSIQKFTTRLGNFLNEQKLKCIQMINTKIPVANQNFNENEDILCEETLDTSRSKTSFQLENEENLEDNKRESGKSAFKYLKLHRLFPKCRKKTLTIEESLEANKEELKRIELEIKKIEEDIEANHKELTQNTKEITSQNVVDKESLMYFKENPTRFKTFTKWRSKIKTSNTNEEFNEINLNKIVKLDVSSKEIIISPKNFEGNSETDFLSPFTSIETTPELNTSNSSLEVDLTISEWISNLICKSKTFLGEKFRSRSKFSVDLSDDEGSGLNEVLARDEDAPRIDSHEPSTSKENNCLDSDRFLLGLQPINLRISSKHSSQSDLEVTFENLDLKKEELGDFTLSLPSYSNHKMLRERSKIYKEEKKWRNLLYSKLLNIQNKNKVEKEVNENCVEMRVLSLPNRITKSNEQDYVKNLEQTTDKLRSPKEENTKKLQTNGYKPLFPEESLNNLNEKRLKKLQKHFWADEKPETSVKELEIVKKTKREQLNRDVYGELIDILQNIKQSVNEVEEQREILSFRDTKSDHSIKPLKVRKQYRKKVAGEEKTEKKQTDLMGNSSKDSIAIETLAIVHRNPD